MFKQVKTNKVLGYYSPAFFYMELNTETTFDNLLLNEKTELIFFHEYIHFLQDIFCLYGVNNIRHILILLKDKISYMQKNKQIIKKLPAKYSSALVSGINELFKYQYGEKNKNTIENLNKYGLNVTIKIINSESVYIDGNDMLVHYISFNEITEKYQLGSIDIIEGMAFLLGKRMFKNIVQEAPAFPYRTIEILIEYYCPFSFPDNLYIIALCELSLCCDSPMEIFMETIKKFKEKLFVPKNMEDFIENVMIEEHLKQYNYLHSVLVDDTLKEFEYIFDKDNYFSDILLWVKTLLLKAKEVKGKNNYLPITNYFKDNDKNAFHKLISNEIGTPIIYLEQNKQGYYFNVNNATKDLYIFRVLENFFNSLYVGYGCFMEDYCREKSKIYCENNFTDNNCKNIPSKRASELYENLCPYAVLWKYFGLKIDLEFKKMPNFV